MVDRFDSVCTQPTVQQNEKYSHRLRRRSANSTSPRSEHLRGAKSDDGAEYNDPSNASQDAERQAQSSGRRDVLCFKDNVRMKTPLILGFFGPYRFLSNFHFVNVEYDGMVYRTTEHAYQAAKTFDIEARERIQRMTAPRDARAAGQLVKYRDDWEQIKDDVMYDLTCQKYAYDPLRSMLLETSDAYLEETNTWGDRYWGVCQGTGQNKLGKILMKVRSDLRAIQEQEVLDAMGR
jgi:N-glycosidase YbiA